MINVKEYVSYFFDETDEGRKRKNCVSSIPCYLKEFNAIAFITYKTVAFDGKLHILDKSVIAIEIDSYKILMEIDLGNEFEINEEIQNIYDSIITAEDNVTKIVPKEFYGTLNQVIDKMIKCDDIDSELKENILEFYKCYEQESILCIEIAAFNSFFEFLRE